MGWGAMGRGRMNRVDRQGSTVTRVAEGTRRATSAGQQGFGPLAAGACCVYNRQHWAASSGACSRVPAVIVRNRAAAAVHALVHASFVLPSALISPVCIISTAQQAYESRRATWHGVRGKAQRVERIRVRRNGSRGAGRWWWPTAGQTGWHSTQQAPPSATELIFGQVIEATQQSLVRQKQMQYNIPSSTMCQEHDMKNGGGSRAQPHTLCQPD